MPVLDRARQAALRVPGSRRAARPATRSPLSTASASAPRTTTTSSSPASASVSRTCWRTGRPSSGASSFAPPNRVPAPAASTIADTLDGRSWSRRLGDRARSFIGRPEPPYRSATISARMASAVSAGARPPRSRPTGPRSRARSASLTPASSRRARRSPWVFFEPDGPDVAAPAPQRLDDRRLVELHVVRQDGDRVVRAEADLVGDLVRPADDQAVDVGEALGRREGLAAVDDDRLEAELAGQPDERASDLHAADDRRAAGRTGKTSMNSERPSISVVRDRPRRSASVAALDELGVRLGRARASRSGSRRRVTTSSASGGAPTPGSCGPNVAGGESPGSGVMTAEPWPPRPDRAASRGDHGRRRDRLHEHVDRAAAGETDVPRLLVADPVADDPRVAGGAGTLDLLRRGALHAAAAHRIRRSGRRRRTAARRLPVGARSRTSARPPPARRRRPTPPSRPASRAAPSSQWPRCGGIDRLAADDRRRGPDRPARRHCRRRAARRGPRPRSPAACPRPGRRRGSRRAVRGWRPSRPAGSRRCTGRRRASRRPVAGSRPCPPAG